MRFLYGSTLCADSFVRRAFSRGNHGRICAVAVQVTIRTLCLTSCSIMRFLYGSTLCADSFVCRAFCRGSHGRICAVAVQVTIRTRCLTGSGVMRLLYGTSVTTRFCLCSSGFTLRLRSLGLCTRLACIAEGRRIDTRVGHRLCSGILNRR